MARIAGINIPNEKHISIALTYIYGIGHPLALKICQSTKIDPAKKVSELSDEELDTIRHDISQYPVEGEMRRQSSMNIKMMMDLGSYKGIRHRRGLPVNGQRSKTNARTRKGPRRLIKSKN